MGCERSTGTPKTTLSSWFLYLKTWIISKVGFQLPKTSDFRAESTRFHHPECDIHLPKTPDPPSSRVNQEEVFENPWKIGLCIYNWDTGLQRSRGITRIMKSNLFRPWSRSFWIQSNPMKIKMNNRRKLKKQSNSSLTLLCILFLLINFQSLNQEKSRLFHKLVKKCGHNRLLKRQIFFKIYLSRKHTPLIIVKANIRLTLAKTSMF